MVVSVTKPTDEPKIQARAFKALDFLERLAGEGSLWVTKASEVFDKNDRPLQWRRARERSETSSEPGRTG